MSTVGLNKRTSTASGKMTVMGRYSLLQINNKQYECFNSMLPGSASGKLAKLGVVSLGW